jgi:hypothetical protein
LKSVAVNTDGILNSKIILQISSGAAFTCAVYTSPFTCFLIFFNDSNACSGNGKNF